MRTILREGACAVIENIINNQWKRRIWRCCGAAASGDFYTAACHNIIVWDLILYDNQINGNN